jgi:hypothetical protein
MGATEHIEGYGAVMPIFEAENLESRRDHWEQRRDEGETIVCRAEEVLGKIAIPGQLLLPLHEGADGSVEAISFGSASLQSTVTV